MSKLKSPWLDPGWGFKTIIPSNCHLKTPGKNYESWFFFLVSSLVVLHAWVLPIHGYLLVSWPVFLSTIPHVKLDCLIGLIRTTNCLIVWFQTSIVYSTSFLGFIVWSFIYFIYFICLTIWIPQFLKKNGKFLWEMMMNQCTGHWTFSHMSGHTKIFRCWLYVIIYIKYTYIYIYITCIYI